jgi:hypothetical protein
MKKLFYEVRLWIKLMLEYGLKWEVWSTKKFIFWNEEIMKLMDNIYV